MIVYKYIDAKYSDDFANGKVRISPAHSFRAADGFQDGRSDFNELKRKISVPEGKMTVNSKQNPLLKNFFTFVGEEEFEMTFIGDLTVIVDQALMCCFSTDRDDEIDRRMKEIFGAGAVFEISDIALFGRMISNEVFSKDVAFQQGSVQYSNEIGIGPAHFFPVDRLRKGQAFLWQKEYRLIWSTDNPSEPFVINVPSLATLIKRLK